MFGVWLGQTVNSVNGTHFGTAVEDRCRIGDALSCFVASKRVNQMSSGETLLQVADDCGRFV